MRRVHVIAIAVILGVFLGCSLQAATYREGYNWESKKTKCGARSNVSAPALTHNRYNLFASSSSTCPFCKKTQYKTPPYTCSNCGKRVTESHLRNLTAAQKAAMAYHANNANKGKKSGGSGAGAALVVLGAYLFSENPLLGISFLAFGLVVWIFWDKIRSFWDKGR